MRIRRTEGAGGGDELIWHWTPAQFRFPELLQQLYKAYSSSLPPFLHNQQYHSFQYHSFRVLVFIVYLFPPQSFLWCNLLRLPWCLHRLHFCGFPFLGVRLGWIVRSCHGRKFNGGGGKSTNEMREARVQSQLGGDFSAEAYNGPLLIPFFFSSFSYFGYLLSLSTWFGFQRPTAATTTRFAQRFTYFR